MVQHINFHPDYFDDVVSGRKTSSVRWIERIALGDTVFRFDTRELNGRVTLVSSVSLEFAVPTELLAPPDTDIAEFAAVLRRNYYPNMPRDAVVDVVTFDVEREVNVER